MHHAKFSRPPTARMLRIHEELKRGAVVTSTLMGKALEASPKTILRDFEFTRDQLKLPTKFDSHRGTYLYWRPVETFPAIKTTEGDVVALLLAQKALEQYHGTVAAKRGATSRLVVALREADEMLADGIDPLMLPLAATHPEFYATYAAAREIVDRPATHAPAGTADANPTGKAAPQKVAA